jgi:hypothetical protein
LCDKLVLSQEFAVILETLDWLETEMLGQDETSMLERKPGWKCLRWAEIYVGCLR